MTYLPLLTPSYVSAGANVTTNGFQQACVLAPPKLGWYWGGYQMDCPNSSGGIITTRLDVDGVGTLYNGSSDEDGSASMYVHHMGIHIFSNQVWGPGNVMRLYIDRGNRGATLSISLFLTFIPSQQYPR